MAILSWFLIVDFPDKAHKKRFFKPFLTEAEARFVEQRIEKDRSDATADPLTWAKVGQHLRDLKLWALYVIPSRLAPRKMSMLIHSQCLDVHVYYNACVSFQFPHAEYSSS